MAVSMFLNSVVSVEWKSLGELDSPKSRQGFNRSLVQIPSFVAMEARYSDVMHHIASPSDAWRHTLQGSTLSELTSWMEV